jgi:hypothetical protein
MPRTEPVRITINIEIHPTVERHEIDRAEWNAMTTAGRRDCLDDLAEAAIQNAGGYGWSFEDPDDEASIEDGRSPWPTPTWTTDRLRPAAWATSGRCGRRPDHPNT